MFLNDEGLKIGFRKFLTEITGEQSITDVKNRDISNLPIASFAFFLSLP